MNSLLDSDFCIAWLKGDPAARNWLGARGWERLAISAITLAELYVGAYKSNRLEENLALIATLTGKLVVLSLTDETLRRFAEIKIGLQRSGTPLEDFDLFIAASELTEGRTLVTHNTRHFQRIAGLSLEDWHTA